MCSVVSVIAFSLSAGVLVEPGEFLLILTQLGKDNLTYCQWDTGHLALGAQRQQICQRALFQ
jgi:hypothetical protein